MWIKHSGALLACLLLILLLTPQALAVVVLKVDESGRTDPFPRNNARQLASNPFGQWFLAYQGNGTGSVRTYLSLSRIPDSRFQGDFHPPILLISGDDRGVLDSGGGEIRLRFRQAGESALYGFTFR